MFTIKANNPQVAYDRIIQQFRGEGYYEPERVPSRSGDTLELHPAFIEIEATQRRLVTPFGRPVNPAFSLAEVLWILSGSRGVEMLQHYNSTIGDYSDDGDTFNAAYGYRLKHEFGFDQLRDMIDGLRADPGSRQAILNIWSPEKDRSMEFYERITVSADQPIKDYPNPVPRRTKDRACNLMSHAMIRGGRLDWVQLMRSNDAIWGTPNNFMQWMHIHEYVAASIGVPVGRYFHFADSLHVYERHWGELNGIRYFDLYDALGWEHRPLDSSATALSAARTAERSIRDTDTLAHTGLEPGSYWAAVVEIFEAWKCYKEGQDEAALGVLLRCTDPVLAAAQARHFYWFRWYKDDRAPRGLLDRLSGRFTPSVAHWATSGHA